MQDAFLAASGARALLMPQIRPISEGEEDLTLLSGLAGLTTLGAGTLDLPPAISPLERTLTLMLFVMKWRAAMADADPDGAGAGSNTPAQAAALAADLGRLMDMIETEAVAFTDLQSLVPEQFAQHWQKTVRFLGIVTDGWPHYLEVRGCVSAIGRRNALIAAEAERLESTATERSRHRRGCHRLDPGHRHADARRGRTRSAAPSCCLRSISISMRKAGRMSQRRPSIRSSVLKKLLDALGVAREDVRVLRRTTRAQAARTARAPHQRSHAPVGDDAVVARLHGRRQPRRDRRRACRACL